MFQWFTDNWFSIAFPALAFFASIVVGLWLRRIIDNIFRRWASRTKWEGSQLIMATIWRPFLLWFMLLGAIIATHLSELPPEATSITTKLIGSLFILSLGWVVTAIGAQLIKIYLPRIKAPQTTITWVTNAVRVTFIVVCVLVVLDIWAMPTTPFLLLIVVAVLVAMLALRNAAPNLFAGFQLSASQQIKIGDYIKLETGEEGYVTDISWSNTRIKALDESTIIIPNSRLLQHSVINYGHPLKKAKQPFRFSSRTHLTELTGLKTKNLREFVDVLNKSPDAVIYYHTHHFLEEHYYLTPELSNDFAVWVSEALGDKVLGEKLASVDTFEFPNMGALRGRLVGVIEEYLAEGSSTREAMPGREFYFMKSVSVVLPTPYIARDLREFVEALRQISLGSLYFHIFDSKLRLGRGFNDFSIWLQDNLDETELSEEIARLNPYTYTLEGLRLALIQLIEKRIK